MAGMTITTTEVAEMLGVTESRVRQLVMSGELTPTVRNSRPLTFIEADVVEYELATRRDRERVARLAERWRACAGQADMRAC